MKKLSILFLSVFFLASCSKKDDFTNLNTPRTEVPEELVGRWARVGISGSTVYNPPSGGTYNTNEYFMGFQINKDGTMREDGYISTYQYGISTWTKWTAYGTVEIDGDAISFHRARGSYSSGRNTSETTFGSSELYPNKSSVYDEFELGNDSRGQLSLIVSRGGTLTYLVKQ